MTCLSISAPLTAPWPQPARPRDIQAREHANKVILLGKSFDTSCPLGPWLTTKDEVGDPQNLKMQLRLNGELRQDANTSDMIYGVRDLVSWWSLRADDPRRHARRSSPSAIAAAAVFCCWAWRPRRRGSRRARHARA
jgi:hypothetical protein